MSEKFEAPKEIEDLLVEPVVGMVNGRQVNDRIWQAYRRGQQSQPKRDYSQPGDPYGIEKTMTSQSAAVDVRGNSVSPSRPVPTQEEADAITKDKR